MRIAPSCLESEAAMLKKILVALDGSENAERVFPWVKQLAGKERAQVVLFRAVDVRPLDPEFIPSEMKDAANYLQRMEAELHYAGLPVRTVVRQGHPAEQIVKAAVEARADLILMGTRGGSSVKRWVLGGVTERVLHLSPIPVLPIPSGTQLPKQGRVRRILVPVDGSKLAESAIPWARRLAALLKSRLLLIHVYPVGPGGLKASHQPLYDALHRRMARAIEGMRQAGVKAAFRLQRGDPAERLLCFADRNDLIVTTTHGFGGVKRWIFGSVAEKLIRNAIVPVLVYKTAP
jgi:nucleotide-binding universal stress UspA family protein